MFEYKTTITLANNGKLSTRKHSLALNMTQSLAQCQALIHCSLILTIKGHVPDVEDNGKEREDVIYIALIKANHLESIVQFTPHRLCARVSEWKWTLNQAI